MKTGWGGGKNSLGQGGGRKGAKENQKGWPNLKIKKVRPTRNNLKTYNEVAKNEGKERGGGDLAM